MALSPKLGLKQSQQLAMTPQLQQAIKLLQMTNAELTEFLESELARNPFLEVAPRPGARIPSGSGGARPPAAGPEFYGTENVAAAETLAQHVSRQLVLMPATGPAAGAARLLAYELTEDGYVGSPLAELSARHAIPVTQMELGLSLLQSCSPAGVGARDLAECLRLQLLESDRFDAAMGILLDNIGLIAGHRLPALARKTSLSRAELRARLDLLRSLDPRPGIRFAAEASRDTIPDILVARAPNGGWSVELAGGSVPRLLASNAYAQQIAAAGQAMPENLAEMSNQASWLVRALDRRAKTILRVASSIVRHQQHYFRDGAGHLAPLNMKAVAQDIGSHESTVSRAISGKFIQCAHGVIAVKSLFSGPVPAAGGTMFQSSANVRHRIGRIVHTEPPENVLTDALIVQRLREEGYDIARRTVAKYRKALRIPPASRRRRIHAIKIMER